MKLGADATIPFYEPFQDHYRDRDIDRTQRMVIEATKLTLEETNRTLGLTITASYAGVVDQPARVQRGRLS